MALTEGDRLVQLHPCNNEDNIPRKYCNESTRTVKTDTQVFVSYHRSRANSLSLPCLHSYLLLPDPPTLYPSLTAPCARESESIIVRLSLYHHELLTILSRKAHRRHSVASLRVREQVSYFTSLPRKIVRIIMASLPASQQVSSQLCTPRP